VKRSNLAVLLLVGLLAAGAGLVLQNKGPFRGLEHSSIDARFDVRGKQQPRKDVVIVALDDKSLAADGGRYPINRTHWAKAIEQLAKAGAKTIAVDIQFTEPSGDDDADNALFEAVSAAKPRVVLSTTEVDDSGQTAILGGGEALDESGAHPAISLMSPDSDGGLRHMRASVSGLETFPLVAARQQLGREIKAWTDARWIDYPGPAGTFPRLSLSDVEAGNFPADAVRGKAVVVGGTAAALRDLHRTPADDAMPGPEIQAAALQTVLDDFPLHDAPGWLDVLLVFALAFVTPLVAYRLGTGIGLLAGLVVALLYVIGAQLAFNAGIVVTFVPPLVAAAIAAVATILVGGVARATWVDSVLDRLSPPRGANRRTHRVRALLLLGAALVVPLVGLGFMTTNALRRLDLTSVDSRFDIRGTQKVPPVAVVDIDAKSITGKGRTWPIDRHRHANVIRKLLDAGAKVIGYDVQFTEPSGDDDADNALYLAVKKAGPKIVMSTTEVGTNGETSILGGGQALAETRAIPANGNYATDVDGRIRKVQFTIDHLISFAMATADAYAGHKLPRPHGNTAWIDYPGPPFTVPYISFDDVEKGTWDPASVRGKIVVVGSSAPVLQDRHLTSTTGEILMPGPEIQAVAAWTAIDGFPLRSGAGWINALLVILVGALTPLAALRIRRIMLAVVLGLAGIAAVLVAAQLAFNSGTIITIVYAVAAGLAGIVAAAGIHGLTVAFEREQARDAFARFVPEAVVDQVLQDAQGVRLGGVRREGTVMFSDLRGFTSFSESLQPEQVIEALNMYLTEMSEAILDHGGTLVAYMGDGIMAVFGAPLQQDDHADRALEAARDMLSRMEKFNGYLRDKGLNEGGFKMGIGLNSGPVMSGNVGSERRLEYTALGDTTNTAARLEGMTKGTPHQLFVADTTRSMLTRPAEDLIEVGEAEVRGRVAKVMLWSLADQPAPPPETHTPAAPPVAAGDAKPPLPPMA